MGRMQLVNWAGTTTKKKTTRPVFLQSGELWRGRYMSFVTNLKVWNSNLMIANFNVNLKYREWDLKHSNNATLVDTIHKHVTSGKKWNFSIRTKCETFAHQTHAIIPRNPIILSTDISQRFTPLIRWYTRTRNKTKHTKTLVWIKIKSNV